MRFALRNRRLMIAGVMARRERAARDAWLKTPAGIKAAESAARIAVRESRSEWAANRALADSHERAGFRPESLDTWNPGLED